MGISQTPPILRMQRLLKDSSLLEGMDPESADELARRFGLQPFQQGDVLIKPGHQGRHLLVLLEGRAEIRATLQDGAGRQALTLAKLHAGDTVGEASFFDPPATRNASVIAVSTGVVGLLPHVTYEALVAEGSPAAAQLERNLLYMLAGRLADTNRQLAALLGAGETPLPMTPLDLDIALCNVPGLQGASPEVLAELSRHFHRHEIHDEVLFREDDAAAELHLLVAGEVEVQKQGHDGAEHLVARLGPGVLFGHASILQGCPRLASARAVGQATVLTMAHTRAMALVNSPTVDAAPWFRRAMVISLSRQLAMATAATLRHASGSAR
jgi:CRP-like cAMP-binding protein